MEINIETMVIRALQCIEVLSVKQGQYTEEEKILTDRLCKASGEYYRVIELMLIKQRLKLEKETNELEAD